MYDLGGKSMTLEKVGQSEETHRQKVDPHEIIDRPVIIGQFGDMEKKKIKVTHGGIVRCSYVIFQHHPKNWQKAKRPPTAGRGLKSVIWNLSAMPLSLRPMHLFEDDPGGDKT
jgi:hypothetical protein